MLDRLRENARPGDHDAVTLHLRFRVPDDLLETLIDQLTDDEAVTGVVVHRDVVVEPPGHELSCDVAREHTSMLLATLHEHDPDRRVAVSIEEPLVVLSKEAQRAEKAARGRPEDGVVWEEVEDGLRNDSQLSWSFVAFLTLASLLAGTGRLLDQPILIVGSMVVGPEFAPLAALCYAAARPRPAMALPALVTLGVGLVASLGIGWIFWEACTLAGTVTVRDATTGPQTDFIVSPDGWSFMVALFAGAAGVLSLTATKSSPLVGVFISVTTVPAIGAASLAAAVGAWSEVGSAGVQLGLNVLGILLAGVVTLSGQRLWWRVRGGGRVRPPARFRQAWSGKD